MSSALCSCNHMFAPSVCLQVTTELASQAIADDFLAVQWLNTILTELWPYYDRAAAAMIKVGQFGMYCLCCTAS